MITTTIGYLTVLFCVAALVMYLTKRWPKKIFNYIPGIVIIYVLIMVLYSSGLWQMNEEITATKNFIQGNFVPAMVFMMCLGCNVKKILKLGPKLLLIFACGAITVCVGFFVSFVIFGRGLEYASMIFATVNASYVGASQNFLATANALELPDAGWGNLLLMVNIPYAIWVVILVVLGASFTEKFNAWTKADVSEIHAISERLDSVGTEKRYYNSLDIMILVALAVAAVFVARLLSEVTPELGFINASVWEYIYVSVFGLVLALTPMGNLRGNDELSSFFVLVTITVSASYTNVFQIMDAWVFVIAGFVALAIHGALLMLLAKIFHWDLHSILTSSIANVGGPSSAPVVCGTYHKSYVSIGVLMSAVGCIFGTLVGLTMYQLFELLV